MYCIVLLGGGGGGAPKLKSKRPIVTMRKSNRFLVIIIIIIIIVIVIVVIVIVIVILILLIMIIIPGRAEVGNGPLSPTVWQPCGRQGKGGVSVRGRVWCGCINQFRAPVEVSVVVVEVVLAALHLVAGGGAEPGLSRTSSESRGRKATPPTGPSDPATPSHSEGRRSTSVCPPGSWRCGPGMPRSLR